MAMISVIVPVYNVEKYLSRCLDSILGQSFADLEIILVNDGSSDGSSEICEQYAAQESRIKLIHQENAGAGMARNTGVAWATGRYIGFVDADDWLERDFYEKLLASALETDADMVVCGRKVYNEAGKLQSQVDLKKEVIDLDQYGKLNYLFDYYYNPYRVIVCNKLYKSDLVKQYPFLSERYVASEDSLFQFSLLEKIKKISAVSHTYYCTFQRTASLQRTYKQNVLNLLTNLIFEFDQRINFADDQVLQKRLVLLMFLDHSQSTYHHIKNGVQGSLYRAYLQGMKKIERKQFYRSLCHDFVFCKYTTEDMKRWGYSFRGRLMIQLYFFFSSIGWDSLAAKIRCL